MPLAEAAGARIYFESHGSGEPLLLIAGFGSNTTVYWANIPELARHFRVIAIDPRGSGRSDAPPGPYTMSQLAEDCRAVLDACGVDAAHVAGASMGGMIAQHLALRFPGRVRGLVLACTTPGLPHHVPPPDEAVALFMEAAGIADPAKAVRATYPLNYSDAYAAAHDAQIVARALANEHLRSTPEGRAAQLAAVQGHDTYDRLGELARRPWCCTASEMASCPWRTAVRSRRGSRRRG
ncbi:MAG: alpha/beta fold hydrolase [Chloroflexota bacterium]|nr:alpha/beta fold hydrolase [Chloroflexota bacterium]